MPSIHDRIIAIDNSNIPAGQSLEDYMSKLKTMGIASIYNSPDVINTSPTVAIDNVFYFKSIYKIQLLHQVGAITAKEVARLIGMLDSKDPENWTVAEECINQKFSEL